MHLGARQGERSNATGFDFDAQRRSLFERSASDAGQLSSAPPSFLSTWAQAHADATRGSPPHPATRGLRPGEILNERYTVVDVVGEGGMGLVYRVRDALRPARDLALKTLSPSAVDDARAQRLMSEFRTMAELSHPNIARVHDFERIAGTRGYCFTMEFLEGRDLLVAARGAPLERILDWVVEACRALQYLHNRGFVHADFKPQNVVVSSANSVKVLDFGLSGVTGAGLLLGTPAYMAPELWAGTTADRRVDLYALGVTMYHLVYGRVPFTGHSLLEVLEKHAREPLPLPPADGVRDGVRDGAGDRVGPPVRDIIARLCAKRPEDRFDSAEEVIAALAAGSARAYAPETSETQQSYVSSAPLVGREAEEEALVAYCQARTSPPAPGTDDAVLACVAGPSGVGKSRLVAEVRRRLQLGGLPFVEASCYEGASDELAPLRDAVEALVRLGRAHGADGPERTHRGTLDWLLDGGARGMPPSARGAAASQPAGSVAEEESRRMAALRGLADFALDLSEAVAFVLSIGDLQWGRTSTTDFLKALCERQVTRSGAGRAARVAIVVSYRDDEAAEPLLDLFSGVAPERRRMVALAPLSPEHTAALIASMLGARDVPQSFSDRVAGETGGNPFFIEEVMRALMERGDVFMEAGRWAARTDVAHIEVPPTVAAVLARRLASVDARAQDVLDWLSVYAQPMPQAFLVEASGLGEDAVREALEGLGERHMIVAVGAGRFRPAHDKLREHLYARMPPAARLARHAEVARVLDRAARSDTEYVIERAHHYWHARDDGHAREWAERALALAEQTFAVDVAIDNCERLRDLAARRGDETARRRAVERLLELCAIPGQYTRMLALSEAELARLTDPVDRARVYVLQGEGLGALGRLAEGIEKLYAATALLGQEVPRSPALRRLFIGSQFAQVLALISIAPGWAARPRRLSPEERRRRELLATSFWLMGIYAALNGDEEGYGLLFAGIRAALPLGRQEIMTKLLANGAFASHILGRYRASERLIRMARQSATTDQQQAIVLTLSVLARQFAQLPIYPDQRPVQAHEAELLRAIETLSTRSKMLHANVTRMVATTAIYKYAPRYRARPEIAYWAEVMRGTVHYGYVQGAAAAMAQIEGDRRRAERSYALALAGCTTDVYRVWVAGDFAYACAVTNDVDKAIDCVKTVRRILPAMQMKADATRWAAAMTTGACIVLRARGADPAWVQGCLEEVLAKIDPVRRLPPNMSLFREAGCVALGRSGLEALRGAHAFSRSAWEVERTCAGHPEGSLVAALALERSSREEDRRVAVGWAREVVALVDTAFPASYAAHVRDLLAHLLQEDPGR